MSTSAPVTDWSSTVQLSSSYSYLALLVPGAGGALYMQWSVDNTTWFNFSGNPYTSNATTAIPTAARYIRGTSVGAASTFDTSIIADNQPRPLTGTEATALSAAVAAGFGASWGRSAGYFFHGFAPNQTSGSDTKFLDYSGALNDGTFQTNLSAATAWGSVIGKVISSLTGDGTTSTVTTSTNHGLSTGQSVTVVGASVAGFNTTATITVTGATTFTYLSTGTPSATGASYYSSTPSQGGGLYQQVGLFQPNPVTASNLSLVAFPAISWDYLGGDSLLIFWRGRATPEASSAPVIGNTTGTSANGFRVVCTAAGALQFNAYQASGAAGRFGGTSGGTMFVADATHDFMVVVDGAQGKHCYWLDGARDSSYSSGFLTLGSGGIIDTVSSTTIKLGGDGGTSSSIQLGPAMQTEALVILTGRRGLGAPVVADCDTIAAALHRNPRLLVSAASW